MPLRRLMYLKVQFVIFRFDNVSRNEARQGVRAALSKRKTIHCLDHASKASGKDNFILTSPQVFAPRTKRVNTIRHSFSFGCLAFALGCKWTLDTYLHAIHSPCSRHRRFIKLHFFCTVRTYRVPRTIYLQKTTQVPRGGQRFGEGVGFPWDRSSVGPLSCSARFGSGSGSVPPKGYHCSIALGYFEHHEIS